MITHRVLVFQGSKLADIIEGRVRSKHNTARVLAVYQLETRFVVNHDIKTSIVVQPYRTDEHIHVDPDVVY